MPHHATHSAERRVQTSFPKFHFSNYISNRMNGLKVKFVNLHEKLRNNQKFLFLIHFWKWTFMNDPERSKLEWTFVNVHLGKMNVRERSPWKHERSWTFTLEKWTFVNVQNGDERSWTFTNVHLGNMWKTSIVIVFKK